MKKNRTSRIALIGAVAFMLLACTNLVWAEEATAPAQESTVAVEEKVPAAKDSTKNTSETSQLAEGFMPVAGSAMITFEDQLADLFPDANFRAVVFEAVRCSREGIVIPCGNSAITVNLLQKLAEA